MDPKVKYSHYDYQTALIRTLLPTLERIVPAAQVVAREEQLTADQREQLDDNFALMRSAHRRLQKRYDNLGDEESSSEKTFICAVMGGGINNLVDVFSGYSMMPYDSQVAAVIEPSLLHPFFRIYNDMPEFAEAGINITLYGMGFDGAAKCYEGAPLMIDNHVMSEAMYAVIFSALLFAGGERKVSLDFRTRDKGERGFIDIENKEGDFANHLLEMEKNPDTRLSFLQVAFDAGMYVHGATITLPFNVARIG